MPMRANTKAAGIPAAFCLRDGVPRPQATSRPAAACQISYQSCALS
ncbi:hypothetical protein [Lysobacter gummosus]